MSLPSVVKGQYFDVAVDVTSLNITGTTGYIVLCGLTSRGNTHAAQTSDEYIRDCSDPTFVPVRVVNVTGQSWDISGSGVVNRAQTALLDAMVGKSLPTRFIEGEPTNDAIHKGFYSGPFVLDSYAKTGADGTNATMTLSWKSDGAIIYSTGSPA